MTGAGEGLVAKVVLKSAVDVAHGDVRPVMQPLSAAGSGQSKAQMPEEPARANLLLVAGAGICRLSVAPRPVRPAAEPVGPREVL